MRITHEIEITTSTLRIDAEEVPTRERGDKMLVELYRTYVGDYPKFYKMDTLCRLGFIGAELLLRKEPVHTVILANRSASIKNDSDYLATISDGHYYPSPSLFVYTLPNIVAGEIAIRNHIHGETSFYVLEEPGQLDDIIAATINEENSPVLAGWVECSGPDMYYAKLQIIWNN